MGKQPRQARQLQPPQPESALTAEPSDDDPKVQVARWTGGLACALWIATRNNIHEFAAWLGVGASTVETWKDHPGIVPTPTNQRVLDEALCRLDDEAKRKFALLTMGSPHVWVSDSLGLTRIGNGEHADREQFLKALAATLGTAATQAPLDALERIAAAATHDAPVDPTLVADHEELADALARLHRTLRPEVLVDQVAGQAKVLLGLLDRPMASAERRRLEAVTVGSHAQAGLLALYLCDRTAMRGYFALARQVADDSTNPTLQAQAAAVSSVMYSAIQTDGHIGDIKRALRLKRQAAQHARASDSQTMAWAQRWLAEELAVTGDERGFRQAIQVAQRLGGQAGQQDGRGFFARYLALTPAQQDRSLGVGLLCLHHADEAIDVLQAAINGAGSGWMVMTLTDIAAARILQDEPEQACQALARAFKLARDHGDAMGLQRIHVVRTQFLRPWANLSCVQDLDELLQSAQPPHKIPS